MSLIVYFSSILACILLFYLFNTNSFFLKIRKKSKIWEYILNMVCFLPLIFLFTVRENVGTDYLSYEKTFNKLLKQPKSLKIIFVNYVEPGWVLLTYFSLLFSKSFLLFKLIISILFFTYVSKIIEYSSFTIKFLVTFLVFTIMFLPFMNITRQMLAGIIILYALLKLLDNNYKLVILNVLGALLIHKSSLIFFFIILAYYLYQKKPYLIFKNQKITLFEFGEYTMILSPLIIIPIVMVLIYIIKIFNINSYYIYENTNVNINFMLYSIPVIIMYKYFVNKFNINDEKIKFIYYLSLINIVFQSFGIIILFFDRMSIYFYSM